MYKKTVNDRYLVLLILFAFCLSSATIGGPLLYGQEVHYGHHSVHIHYTEEDHDIGETDCSDTNIALYHDYLTLEPSGSIKTYSVINLFLHTHFYPEYHHNFSEISSVHHSSINRFCFASLYQLHSSYLI